MRRYLLGAAGAAFLSLASAAAAQGTGSAGNGNMAGMSGNMAGMQMSQDTSYMAMLSPTAGARGPSGMAMISGTTAQLWLSNDQAGSTRPWRLHKGTCGNDGGVVGEASAYSPVAVGANGKGAAKATLPAPLAADGSYFVAVHASQSNMKTIVACGPVAKGGM